MFFLLMLLELYQYIILKKDNLSFQLVQLHYQLYIYQEKVAFYLKHLHNVFDIHSQCLKQVRVPVFNLWHESIEDRDICLSNLYLQIF